MKQFLKNNWIGIIAVIFFLIIIGIEVKERQEKCWLYILDGDGNGLSTPTDYSCKGLKNTCESSNHNVPCRWVSGWNEGCFCEVWK